MVMKKQALDRRYVSDADKFIAKIKQNTPLSDSQKKEIAKHERIFNLRDNEQEEDKA